MDPRGERAEAEEGALSDDEGIVVSGEIDYSKAVELPAHDITVKLPARRADYPKPRMMTKVRCACRRYCLAEGERVCWECKFEAEERASFLAQAEKRLTRAEALSELHSLASGGDTEGCHVSADMVLLQLLGDPEIAEAFFRVPKWYA